MSNLSLFDEGAPPSCPCPFNLADYVMSAGLASPEKVALEILSSNDVEIWTYNQLWSAVRATAGALQGMDLRSGSRILLRLGNEVDFPILFLAAIWAGLVPVPTSNMLTTPEISAMISDVQPSLICKGEGVAAPTAAPCPVMTASEIRAARNHHPGQVVYGDPDRLAYIIYTSGTSGKPRAVLHAHRAIWARRMMWQDWIGLRQDDRLLHAGAFSWTYTLGVGLCDPWAAGATSLIAGTNLDRANLASMMGRRHVSIFAAVPGVYRQLLKLGSPLDFPELRHGLSAGEKLSPQIRAAWFDRTGREIHEAFGMSEISTFLSSSADNPASGPGVGRPQKGRRVAVLDEKSRQPVRFGTPGILAVAKTDPGLMLGYLGDETTVDKGIGDQWFLTGDTVIMEKDGRIIHLGRNDDMMNAGGFRVSPLEVENMLNTHPQITHAACTAVEIKADTFVIAAFYQSGIDLVPDELARFCAKRLARYKCPRLFLRLDSLPTGRNGKLQRGALAQIFKDRT